jgi:hypothetical protein
MWTRSLYVAAALTLTPFSVFAQSADPDHPAPGDGYRIPATQRVAQQPLAAYPIHADVPGDGYRIVAVPRTDDRPLAAYQTPPGVPGDGYRMR